MMIARGHTFALIGPTQDITVAILASYLNMKVLTFAKDENMRFLF